MAYGPSHPTVRKPSRSSVGTATSRSPKKTTRPGEPGRVSPSDSEIPMSEQQSTESTTTKGTEQSAKPSDVAEQLGENGQKALKAELDARKAAEKALSDLNAQLDQMKQAQMSDLEKALAQARSFEEAAASAKSEA